MTDYFRDQLSGLSENSLVSVSALALEDSTGYSITLDTINTRIHKKA